MKLIINIIAVAAFCGLLTVTLLEWAVGCGETYTDSKGVTHSNECVFININR
jgi:nitrogen fixation-related uncharacterized protein